MITPKSAAVAVRLGDPRRHLVHSLLSLRIKGRRVSVTIEPQTAVELPEFITRWAASAASERANYQLFLSELCEFLSVPKPNPSVADVSKNAYVFERDVRFQNADGTTSD